MCVLFGRRSTSVWSSTIKFTACRHPWLWMPTAGLASLWALYIFRTVFKHLTCTHVDITIMSFQQRSRRGNLYTSLLITKRIRRPESLYAYANPLISYLNCYLFSDICLSAVKIYDDNLFFSNRQTLASMQGLASFFSVTNPRVCCTFGTGDVSDSRWNVQKLDIYRTYLFEIMPFLKLVFCLFKFF